MKFSLTQILYKYCFAMGLIGKSEEYLFPTSIEYEHLSTHAAFYRFKHILNQAEIILPNLPNSFLLLTLDLNYAYH